MHTRDSSRAPGQRRAGPTRARRDEKVPCPGWEPWALRLLQPSTEDDADGVRRVLR